MGQPRIRSKYKPDDSSTRWYRETGAEENVYWEDYPHTASVEVMVDEVNRRYLPPGEKYPWQPCSHAKATCLPGERPPYFQYPEIWDPFGPTLSWSYGGKWMPYDWAQDPINTLLMWTGQDLSSNAGLLPDGVAGFHSRRAIETIVEQIPQTVSIANFAAELRGGLKSLLPRIQGVVKTIGSGWLWWNFSAMPMVRDIKALLSSISDTRARLDYLKKVNGTVQTVNYNGSHEVSRGSADEPEVYGGFGPTDLSVNGTDFIRWDTYDLHLECRVKYDLDLNGWDAFLNAMCSTLGLYNPAQIVWEAIPFSFVVEWFTNFSDWLDENIDVAQPFEGTIEIVGANHSIRRRTMVEHWIPTDNRGNGAVYSSTLVRVYHRRAGTFGGTCDTAGLDAHKLSLVAALLSQGLGSGPYTRLRK